MTTAQTGQWRELFQQYTDAGEFHRKNRWDIMALRYVYMDLIRAHLAHFVNVWNAHYIRNQRKRPHHPTGRPNVLFNDPDVQNYASKPSAELLQKLKDEVGDWDEDAYLDSSVIEFCTDTLITIASHQRSQM